MLLTYSNTTRLASKPPPIFCLGFAKCGTSTLYEYLALHADVAPAVVGPLENVKEIGYFSDPNQLKMSDGMQRYEDKIHAQTGASGSYAIDFTPGYAISVHALQSIKQAYPDQKVGFTAVSDRYLFRAK